MSNFFRFIILLFFLSPLDIAGQQTPSKYSSTASITIRVFSTFDSSGVKNYAAALYDTSGIKVDSQVAVDTNLIRFLNVSITGVHESRKVPNGYFLGQNYPNPFNPSSIIKFTVPRAGPVSFKTYTILGQEDASLEMTLEPGSYEVEYKPGGAAGILFYRLMTKDFMETRKMIQFGGEKLGRSSLTLVSSGAQPQSQHSSMVVESQANNFIIKLYDLSSTYLPFKDTTIQITGLMRDTTVTAYVAEATNLTSGLVLYYPFEGNLIDSSHSGNSGSSINAQYVSDTLGYPNSAYQFNGVDNFITVPNSMSLNPERQLTVTLWLRVDTIANNYMDIFVKGGPVYGNFANREYALYVKQHIAPYYYLELKSAGDSSGQLGLNSEAYVPGQWVFFATIIDRIKHAMKIYANGVATDSLYDSYSSFNINNDSLMIGWSEENLVGHSPLRGAIDNLRIYTRVLTPAEILLLYTSHR